MTYIQKILSVSPVTHDVRRIRIEKPRGYQFIPGQATEVAINKEGWEDEKRPFTFTCLNEDPYLEFTIKSYSDHPGVTNEIAHLKADDELILDDPWGAISYEGEGYFIAGGAGITPFIAILRQLHKEGRLNNNKLFFSNKTPADIIYEEELKGMLGENSVFIVTDSPGNTYPHDFIDKAFLNSHVSDFSKHFYICGPDPMIKSISDILVAEGAKPEAVVFEK
jgi:ferredoxin-NADP reductase